MLTTTAYFPPLHWFTEAYRVGQWTWEAHENYQKGGWRNRCRIMTANGPLLLSIPLQGGKHQQQPIQEVVIDYRTDWQRLHAQTIRSAYGRSPYFEFYGDEVLQLLRRQSPTLWDYNLHLTNGLLGLLHSSLSVGASLSFAGGAAGEKVTGGSAPRYRQVFEERHGFVGGLSVLDGLFCLGPAVGT